jgi:hypothetical protein
MQSQRSKALLPVCSGIALVLLLFGVAYQYTSNKISTQFANGAFEEAPPMSHLTHCLGSLKFRVPPSEPVGMSISYSTHYQIDTKEGEEEWAHLLPSGGHLVHLDHTGDIRPYTVTLFHQLKCLDYLRQQYITIHDDVSMPYTQHCLNYLRQTLLCQANIRIESAKDAGSASRRYDVICNDWTRVYEAAEQNHEAFLTRATSRRL